MIVTYNPGIYSATATSFGGPLTLEVTVDEKTIKDIRLVAFNDTIMVGDTAFETIRQQILDYQTLNVDSVSGAGVSSAAIKKAVTAALKQAGADIEVLKTREIKKVPPKQLNLETDVLVIGTGLAGIAAAIEAAKKGSNVIMLERLGRMGGTTALSAGLVYAAGTTIQAKNNVEDNAERFFEDWMMLAKRANDEYVDEDLVRFTTEHSAENIEWLIANGVPVMDEVFPASMHEGRYIPRTHQTEGGGYMVKHLVKTAEKLGVDVRVNTRAMELMKDGDSVIGAKAVDKDGSNITVKAKAVIIASGGFARNSEMIEQYYPQYKNYIKNSVNIGDSLKMGEAIGADIIVKNAALLFHVFMADFSLSMSAPECIYVTPAGERYIDETEYMLTRTRVLRDLGLGDTNMIVPQMLYAKHKEGIDKAMKTGKAFQADTIEEIAYSMDMNPAVLRKTIERYNQLVKAGVDSDFNKPSEYLYSIEAPYIGLKMTPSISDTFIGMRINIHAQVIDKKGSIINGLYAVGAAAPAQTLNQEYIGSGAALLHSLTFGRVAGAHAASIK